MITLATTVMTGPAGLAAGPADETDWLQILLFLVFVVGMGIVSIIKKAMERAAEKRSRESIEQPKEQPEPAAGGADEDLARVVRRSMNLPVEPPARGRAEARRMRAAPESVPAAPGVEPPPRAARPRRKAREQPARPPLAQTAEPGPAVSLQDPHSARMAIIHHEILAPPKALREQPEMWDL